MDYVRLKGFNYDLFVVKEDWVKVAPLVQEGAFSTFEFPKYPAGVPLQGNLARTLSEIDGPDRIYYLHVLAQLWVLFQDTWPT